MEHPPEAPPAPKSRYRMFFFLPLIIMPFVMPWLLGGPDGVRAVIEGLRAFGPISLVYLAMLYVGACVAMLPGILLTVGAGFLAAVFWPGEPFKALAAGYLTAGAGSIVGATLAFIISRFVARNFVASKIAGNARFEAIDHAMGRGGLRMVFLMRLSPLFPFSILNYALGLTRISLKDYFIASSIGMFPGTLLYVYLGTTAQELTNAATGGGELGWARIALLVAGLVATFAVVWYVTRAAQQALKEAGADEPALMD